VCIATGKGLEFGSRLLVFLLSILPLYIPFKTPMFYFYFVSFDSLLPPIDFSGHLVKSLHFSSLLLLFLSGLVLSPAPFLHIRTTCSQGHYFYNLKREAVSSSETVVKIYQTTWRQIQEKRKKAGRKSERIFVIPWV
jgi:hypothetical protein